MTVIMKVHTMVRVFQDTVGEFSVYGNRRLPQQRSRHVHQCTVWKWHCWRRRRMRLRLGAECWG